MTELSDATYEAGVGLLRLMLFAIVKATLAASMGIGMMGRPLAQACRHWRKALVSFASITQLAWLRCAPSLGNRGLLLGIAILYQAPAASPLPVPSEDPKADIALKSYELTRSSFLIMTTMGAIMTTLALIKGVIDIVKCCSRRRARKGASSELPRNPVNCESSATAHAILGQHVSDNTLHPDSGEELSSIAEPTAEVDADRQLPATMAMPANGLPRGQE
ncbi:hypothetical protein GGR51DRAFT_30436 [Nemania sp. FL0031]|nr:hypothetical protein GGR51DRAFT_30436 [Nemania sp. FL0031]